MDKNKINKIKELTTRLNICREEYYNHSRPSISDAQYDKMFDELSELEKETGFAFCNSPTLTVGYVVNTYLPKVHHDIPLLSLDKTKDPEQAQNFTGKKDALLMWKLDGLTICLTYEKGKLVQASTRGNGEEGSLITDNAKTFMNIPLTIPYKGYLKITGEGIIHKKDFEQINKELPEEERYKTPRNLASGSVQQLDSGICANRKVYFYAFNVIAGLQCNTLEERLNFLDHVGFDTCKRTIITKKSKFPIEVERMVKAARLDSIPIDGLVIMYNDVKYGESLGRTGHHYKNGIALKFQEEEEETKILDVHWFVGRTGKITPVAEFNTVVLDNTNVSEASLHNISTMVKLGLKKNATVTVVKKNEIIPQIIKSVGGNENFIIPSVCPVCGYPVTIKKQNDTVVAWCDNEDCIAKHIRSLEYFVSNDCMNIKGLSSKSLQKFVEAGLIHSFADIYKLPTKKEEIISFDGMGEKSFELMAQAIEKSRSVKLENFITALSIPNVALSKAKIISKYFDGDWNKFKKSVDNGFDFTVLDGFGEEVNKSIHTFFNKKFNKKEEYERLLKEVKFIVPEIGTVTSNKLSGLQFVITGTLEKFKNRKELEQEIEDNGGKIAGSVSKNTSYLINNDISSSSGKNKKAKELGIPIITENDFINLITK